MGICGRLMKVGCWLVGSCKFEIVNPPGRLYVVMGISDGCDEPCDSGVTVTGSEGWLSGLGAVADGFGSKRLLRTLVVCPAVLGGNTN